VTVKIMLYLYNLYNIIEPMRSFRSVAIIFTLAVN